ncbi:Sec-independent protein translocase subunit TatA [Actinomycetospora sp. CA-053990]|uniref:Sec-independent protein translocase subunit TatA n=1 Tax=Actinomycetospora sp. CA-053990 TaxID=3239891 RepID=UPI003D8F3FB3
MSEWVIIAIVGVVLLFSAKKLPDMARGLGQSMRIFKAETRGLKEDEQASKPGEASATPQAPGRALDEGSSGTNGVAPSSPDATPTPRPGSTS